jgi:hypothetical protein
VNLGEVHGKSPEGKLSGFMDSPGRHKSRIILISEKIPKGDQKKPAPPEIRAGRRGRRESRPKG